MPSAVHDLAGLTTASGGVVEPRGRRPALAAITGARAVARERVWGRGANQDGQVVIDLDATLVAAHSDKQDTTRTWKIFGFHPLLGSSITHRR